MTPTLNRTPVIQTVIWMVLWVVVIGVIDRREFVSNDSDFQPDRDVHGAHPAAAQTRQVVVGRDQVRALFLDGVEVQR